MLNEFKVGLLTIAAILSVVVMSLKITENQSGFGDYVTYRSVLSNASGIFPKTPIKVAGINAGRITKIELDRNTALVTFEVLKRIKISEGSKLQIKSVGFLGDKYLEIVISENQNRLSPGSILETVGGGGIDELSQDAAILLSDVKEIVRGLKEVLAPQGEDSPLKEMMSDLQEMVRSSKEISKSLEEIFTKNQEQLIRLIANLSDFSETLKVQSDLNNRDSILYEISDIIKNAKKSSEDLSNLIADIRNGKGSVGKFLSEDYIADEVKETLASVNKIVKRADAIKTELQVFTSYNSLQQSSTEAALVLYPAPERFYSLGFKTGEFGPTTETHTTTVTNGVVSEEIESVKEKNSFSLNLQIGRKVQDWSFRGGLIESKGGLGVDYNLTRIGSKISLDAFDFSSDDNANLRISTETHLWNVFYGRVEGDNLLNDGKNYSFSVGLRFLDEDLKGIMGFLL